MPEKKPSKNELIQSVEELQIRLQEAEETLRAIREGEVDAIVVSGSQGEQVFSLFGAESIYRLIVETMKEAAFTVTLDGKILYCNAQFSEFARKSADRIVGSSLLEFIADEDKEQASFLLTIAQGETVKKRLVFRAADGTLVPSHISAHILNEPKEKSICVVASDLTELENSTELIQKLQRQQEELQAANQDLVTVGAALRDSYLEFAALFERSSVAKAEADLLTGRFTRANQALADLTGYSVEEICRMAFSDLTHPDDRQRDLEIFESVRAGLKDVWQGERRYLRKDGTVIWVDVAGNLIRHDNGRPPRTIAVIQDITDRRKAEQQLVELNQSLEKRVEERTAEAEKRALQLRQLATELTLAEQRERQRLAMVLHDGLQQMLVAAKFSATVLQRGGADATEKAAVISGLIDDCIETSRSLTAELSPPILYKGSLLSALEWLANWMRDKHGLTVKLTAREQIDQTPEEITIVVFQSVRELLFNIVKHAGSRTARIDVAQSDGCIQVEVSDAGTGFDLEQLKREDSHAGGMGLFSIRERLGYIGGRMEMESAPGRGSRFRLTAPARTSVADLHERLADSHSAVSIALSAWPEIHKADPNRIRVVLVDDHMVMRQGLGSLLGLEPDICIVGEASDGESAIRLVRSTRPDVVLMDVAMPGMDGIQATKIIHRECPEVSVIGLSMFRQGEQAMAMRQAGAVDYLIKSGPSEAVVEAIRACKRKHGASPSEA